MAVDAADFLVANGTAPDAAKDIAQVYLAEGKVPTAGPPSDSAASRAAEDIPAVTSQPQLTIRNPEDLASRLLVNGKVDVDFLDITEREGNGEKSARDEERGGNGGDARGPNKRGRDGGRIECNLQEQREQCKDSGMGVACSVKRDLRW